MQKQRRELRSFRLPRKNILRIMAPFEIVSILFTGAEGCVASFVFEL